MSPAAVALQFPAPQLIDTEWGEEEQWAADAAKAGEKERRREALLKGLRIGQADGSPTDLTTLKAEVAMVVAGGRGAGPAWPTGVARLDEALGGGVPRGRVTEIVGPIGAGKTSLVRQLVAAVLTSGGWVAWVDATRTLAPQELAGLGERLIVVRPHDCTRGAWCADLLLRSGVFSLVVLDGAPVLSRTLGVRLSQLARERDAAFVVLRDGTQGSRLGGAVRLQVRPLMQSVAPTKTPVKMPIPMSLPTRASVSVSALSSALSSALPSAIASATASPNVSIHASTNASTNTSATTFAAAQQAPPNERKFSVFVEKGGSSGSSYRTIEVTCAIVVARRVCTDTEIPDRRGVARRTRTIAGTGSEHAQSESAVTTAESVRAQPIAASNEQPAIAEPSAARPATGAAVSRKPAGDGAWTGRGRQRMAESTYGRTTRRGKARKFLHTREQQRTSQRETTREHTEYHGTYQRKQRYSDAEISTQSEREARRESRRQSQRELLQYARSLG